MNKVILIVEDDAKNMKLFQDLLQANGYSTLEASNGKVGVEIVKSSRPDLVLMDIMMPVMNGIDAIKAIKADIGTQKIPVIALTSFALPDEKKRISESGCDGYMMKPIRIKALLKMIGNYLA